MVAATWLWSGGGGSPVGIAISMAALGRPNRGTIAQAEDGLDERKRHARAAAREDGS